MRRWNWCIGLSAVCLAVLVGPVFGADPPARMMTKVFDVTELVCLPGDSSMGSDGVKTRPAPSEAVCADRLISNITAMIAPGSWECDGGPGRIEFFEKGRSLVICHEKATIEQIASALEKLKTRRRGRSIGPGTGPRSGRRGGRGATLRPT